MKNKSNIDSLQKLQALEADADFIALQSEVGGLNFFEISGMTTLETKHSKTLAWLFDVSNNYGIREIFAKRFLSQVLGLDLSSSFDYSSLKVETEWVFHNGKYIDLLLYSEKEQTVILIENKVLDKERIVITEKEQRSQLDNYVDGLAVDKKFKAYLHKKYIFLSPDGEPSSNSKWLAADYSMVIKAVNEAEKSSVIEAELKIILKHYIKTIRRFAMDEEVKKKCLEIYKAHKEAIDMIGSLKLNTVEQISACVFRLLKDKANAGAGIYDVRLNGKICRFKTERMKLLLSDKNPITYEIAPSGEKYSRYAWLENPDASDVLLKSVVAVFDSLSRTKKETPIKNQRFVLGGETFVDKTFVSQASELGVDEKILSNHIESFLTRITEIEETIEKTI